MNPHRGEVEIDIGGKRRTLRYDLNALAELGDDLGLSAEQIVQADITNYRNLIAFLWAGLLHEEPDLTKAEVGSWEVPIADALGPVRKAMNLGMLGVTVPVEPNPPKPKAKDLTGKRSSGEPSARSA